MKSLFIFVSFFAAFSVFAGQPNQAVTEVESKKVCMVNDTYFGRDQIPVKVASKTYYGCCENCKKTLKDSEKSRVALDPVTKKPVDKAAAVIGADESKTKPRTINTLAAIWIG